MAAPCLSAAAAAQLRPRDSPHRHRGAGSTEPRRGPGGSPQWELRSGPRKGLASWPRPLGPAQTHAATGDPQGPCAGTLRAAEPPLATAVPKPHTATGPSAAHPHGPSAPSLLPTRHAWTSTRQLPRPARWRARGAQRTRRAAAPANTWGPAQGSCPSRDGRLHGGTRDRDRGSRGSPSFWDYLSLGEIELTSELGALPPHDVLAALELHLQAVELLGREGGAGPLGTVQIKPFGQNNLSD